MKIQYVSFRNINREFELKKENKQLSIKPQNNNFISNVYYQPISFNGGYLTSRAQFLKLKGNITPDKYQEQAMKAIHNDEAVLVEAPTGTGKTLIGEYAINKNLDKNKRTFYTTPLKALTNQKYNDFRRIFGKNKVGIATGDLKENIDAPIVVMTTEIYRNMLNPVDMNKNRLLLHDVGNVIFDEFHFMNDQERGRVWEESVMFTPDNVKPVMLSATMSNSNLLSKWYQELNPEMKIEEVNVSSKDRHVPLNYVGYSPNSSRRFTKLFYGEINLKKLLNDYTHNKLTERQETALKDFTKAYRKNDPNPPSKENITWTLEDLMAKVKKPIIEEENLIQTLVHKMDRETIKRTLPYFLEDGEKKTSFKLDYIEEPETVNQEITKVIENLKKDDMLPAISFIFSKLKCDNLVRYYERNGEDLLSDYEKSRLEMILDDYEARTPALSHHYNRKALLKGVASHHAGLLPGFKKVIEKLFQEGLIKVVFATETLAAGINMPAKSVVFSSMEKPTGMGGKDQLRMLTSSEFQQMSGRAGRRGYDDIGNVVIMQTQLGDFDIANSLANSPPVEIESNFRPSYSLLAQIFEEMPDEKYIDTILDKSFLKYSSEVPHKLKEEFKLTADMLEEKGYIERKGGLSILTPKGQLIKNIRSTNEMLLAEVIDKGLLFDLDPASLTAIVSSLVHDSEKNEISFELPSYEKLEEQIKISGDILESTKIELIEKAKDLGIKSNSVDDLKEKLEKKKTHHSKLQKMQDTFKLYKSRAKFTNKLMTRKEAKEYPLDDVVKSLKENNYLSSTKPYEVIKHYYDELIEQYPQGLKNINQYIEYQENKSKNLNEEYKEFINKNGSANNINNDYKNAKQSLSKILDNSGKKKFEKCLKETLTRTEMFLSAEDINSIKETIEKVERFNNAEDKKLLDKKIKELIQIKENEIAKKSAQISKIENIEKLNSINTKQEVETLAGIYSYLTKMDIAKEKTNQLKGLENKKTKQWQDLNKLRTDYKNLQVLKYSKQKYEAIFAENDDVDYSKEAEKLSLQIAKAKSINRLLDDIKDFTNKRTENYVNMQELASLEREAIDEAKMVDILEQIYTQREEINKMQEDKSIETIPKAMFNSCLATHMFKWANVSEAVSEEEWNNIIKGVINSTDIEFEGEFYRSINLTIDLLKQIMAISSFGKTAHLSTEMQNNYNNLFKSASQAIDMLKKPPIYEPVEDYELEENY